MPSVTPPGTWENPGPIPRWTADEPFWRRHFYPPSPYGILVVAVVLVVVVALIGAAMWTGSDSAVIRRKVSTPTRGLPVAAPIDQDTTTTKPDLSSDTIEKKIAPMVWSVSTLDPSGQPAVASAFAVGSASGQTFLITSLAAVQSSIQAPGPPITAANGSFNGPATLWTWDDQRDLALLAVGRSRADEIPWHNDKPDPKTDDKIFAISSASDNKVSPGILTGVSPTRYQHNIFIDDQRRGGPIVNIKGEVVAISSAAFTGGGTATDAAFFAVPIHGICDVIIRCGGANAPRADTPGAPVSTSSSTPDSSTSSSSVRRSTTSSTAGDETATTEG
jgi:S1-C subfamily serine protease